MRSSDPVRLGKGQTAGIDPVAARPQRLADRCMRALWQNTPGKIVADGAWTDTKKVLQRLAPAKRGDDRRKIMFFHDRIQIVNLHEFM